MTRPVWVLYHAAELRGTLLAWRWLDEPLGDWTALVRFYRDGLR